MSRCLSQAYLLLLVILGNEKSSLDMVETKELANTKNSEQVRVVVRCRPMNIKEMNAGYKNVISVSALHNAIAIREPSDQINECKTFTFDAVYDFTSSQEQLYKESVEPIVDSVLDGFNATIFAYGQTGTGKTYTMEGKQFDRNEKGVIPRSFNQIFDHISYYPDINYTVRCSYIEIYQEEIKDLLDETGRKTYELRGDQSSVYIKNLKSYICKSAAEMERSMKHGNSNRKTGATDMNEHSSRSHAIFIISIEITRTICDMKHTKVGKLNLVDLAGSERQAKSKSSGVRLKEATKINLSLSALGNVISALSKERNAHIPYRNSKLTRILQDSLGGNAKTLMIANIGPACYNYVESLNTLKYANRAKNIKNKPIINEESSKDEMIHKCQIEIERLRKLVQAKCPQKAIQIEFDGNSRKSRKRRRSALIDEEISDLQDAVEDEETRLYDTCEKIEYLQKWKDRVEGKSGTNVLNYTVSQQCELQDTEHKIFKVNANKKELKRKIEDEKCKTMHFQMLNMKKADNMIRNIEKLHKTYNTLMKVKTKTLEVKEQIEVDRSELEKKRYRLLERHGMNQILIDYFIPCTKRKTFMTASNQISSSLPNTETINRRLQKLKTKCSNNFAVDRPLQNCVWSESNRPEKKLNSSISINKQHKHSTNCGTYHPKLRSTTPFHCHKRESKFKDNIIINTNKHGEKQYLIMKKELSSPPCQDIVQRESKFKDVKLNSTFQDSMKSLKNILAMN